MVALRRTGGGWYGALLLAVPGTVNESGAAANRSEKEKEGGAPLLKMVRPRPLLPALPPVVGWPFGIQDGNPF